MSELLVGPLVEITAIPHNEQRIPTWADWEWAGDKLPCLRMRMSALSDWRYLYLGAIHELIEAVICKAKGVPQAAVDEFDADYELRRARGEKRAACGCEITQDPGMDQHAPYLAAHIVATQVEYGIAQVIGVDAATYDKTCAAETEPFEADFVKKANEAS